MLTMAMVVMVIFRLINFELKLLDEAGLLVHFFFDFSDLGVAKLIKHFDLHVLALVFALLLQEQFALV